MSLSSSLSILTTPDTYLNLVQANLKQQLDPLFTLGIRSTVGPWLYEHDSQAWAANSTVGCGWSYGAGTFAASIDNNLVMPFAGSVVGIGVRIASNGAAITPTVIVFKNGTTLDNSLSGAVPNSASATSLSKTFTKGVRSFAAGDTLGVSVFLGSSAFTAAVFINAFLVVEL